MARRELFLVYRSPREGAYSIERLFESLEPFLDQHYKVRKIVLPFLGTGPGAMIRNLFFLRRLVKKNAIVHITGDVQYLLGIGSFDKSVVTIHDCGHLQGLSGLRKWLYRKLWFEMPCRRAAAITVISQATRLNLKLHIGVLADRAEVIHNCLTAEFSVSCRNFNQACPTILQIGTGAHKNLDSLIQAVTGLSCRLAIVGRLNQRLVNLLDQSQINYEVFYDVSDERLARIYADSDLLYFASKNEGFGLPIIEAQMAGLPVITSNILSMPEVAGEGAIFVDPYSVDEIRQAVVRLVEDESLRKRITEAGRKNITRFEPERIAEDYCRVYDSVVTRSEKI